MADGLAIKPWDIYVVWLGRGRRDYVRRGAWVRGVMAATLTEASNIALQGFQDKIYPSVSMGWPQESKQ